VYLSVVCSIACASAVWICTALGANVLAADEEGETCLHLAFARHTATVSLDQADAIQRVLFVMVLLAY